MAENDTWARRAQAEALREEVDLLRGAVAALRATRAPAGSTAPPPRWPVALTAFVVGVAMTCVLVALYREAICP
jgi:hypothetical protein